MIKEFKTRTGAIFCDTEKKMEYLYVGDYGKENNIKADFLGFKKEINQVPHHNVDLKDKMVVTISTQKGCPMNCMLCDCPKVKFGGNISREELAEEVVKAIKFSKCEYTERFNLHLARMGEPSLNAANVLNFLKYDLRDIVNANMKADVIHPVFTTMMPKSLGVRNIEPILKAFCDIKNNVYDGEAGLQLSINSTDEKAVEYGKDLYKRNGSLLDRCRGCYAHVLSSYETGANYVLEEIEKVVQGDLNSHSAFKLKTIKQIVEQLKKTGEIVNISEYAKITLAQCDSWGNPIEVDPEDVELIADVEEDDYWQNVRTQAAIAAMQGVMNFFGSIDYNRETIARLAVEQADALIEQLKEK